MQLMKLLSFLVRWKSLGNTLLNIPNTLTVVRIICAPFLIYLYLNSNFALAFWLMLVAGLTDWFDGFFARKFNQESLFGKLLDPVADKILMITTFITLGYINAIPISFSLLYLSRDMLIIIGALVILNYDFAKSIAPTKASKINTFLQILVILLVTYRLQKNQASHIILSFESILLIITSLFTLVSGFEYIKIFCGFLKNKQE